MYSTCTYRVNRRYLEKEIRVTFPVSHHCYTSTPCPINRLEICTSSRTYIHSDTTHHSYPKQLHTDPQYLLLHTHTRYHTHARPSISSQKPHHTGTPTHLTLALIYPQPPQYTPNAFIYHTLAHTHTSISPSYNIPPSITP